ncbi:DUF4231 domain-containing protein [Paenibacillus polymyxa]|nr:DUF4231 domain-containing protein [Paenibacillus polymyxa]
MSEREYLAERLDDQINWYDKKSIECQKYYKRWKRAEIVAAALIPVLTSFSSGLRWIAIVIGALGACIALFESILSLHKYHENWIEYRGICETLRQEKYMYFTRTGIYKIADGAFNLLVERVESVISKENVNWANLHANEQKKESHQQQAPALNLFIQSHLCIILSYGKGASFIWHYTIFSSPRLEIY